MNKNKESTWGWDATNTLLKPDSLLPTPSSRSFIELEGREKWAWGVLSALPSWVPPWRPTLSCVDQEP